MWSIRWFKAGVGVLGACVLALSLMVGGGALPTRAEGEPVVPQAGGTVDVDPTWLPAGAEGGAVTATLTQPDGKVVIAGEWSLLDGRQVGNILRFEANGQRDLSFNASANGTVYSMVRQADGRIVIAGRFTTVNGVARRGIARLNATSSLDVTFAASGGISPLPSLTNSVAVRAVALDSLGRVVIGGTFDQVHGVPRTNVARLTTTGEVDAGFSASTNGRVDAVAVQADNKVVLAGAFTTVIISSRVGIARLNTNGTLDAGFSVSSGFTIGSPAMPGNPNALLLQPDGRVLVGGSFDAYNGTPRNCLARLQTNGNLDTSFSAGTSVCASAFGAPTLRLASRPDGATLVSSSIRGARAAYRLVALGSTGVIVADYASWDRGAVEALAVLPDGRLLVGGRWLRYRDEPVTPVLRVLADGSHDPTFAVPVGIGVGFNNPVTAVTVQPDGKTVIGGRFDTYNGMAVNGLARLNGDGTLDTSFDVGLGTWRGDIGSSLAISAVVSRPDGKVVAIGEFSTFNGVSRPGIVQVLANGAVDAGFNPATGFTGGQPRAMALLPDGRIIVVGGFTAYRGVARKGIVAIRPDGTVDAGFDPGVGFSGTTVDVTTLAVQTDGKIVAGGGFTGYRGTARNGIVRINANGTLDATFNPGTGFSAPYTYLHVEAVAVGSDGRITVGGGFTGFNGVVRNQLARLNANGTLDATFNPGDGFVGGSGPAVVQSLVVLSGGSVVVTGRFITLQGLTRNGIAKVRSTGVPDPSFAPGTGFTQAPPVPWVPAPDFSDVPALAVAADGRITVGGDFTAFNDVFPRPLRITRLVTGPPGLPVGLTATNGDTQALLTFQMSTGGVADSFQYSLDGGPWTAALPASPTLRVVVSGLVNGVPRGVRVRGVNELGPGGESAPVTVTPQAPTASRFVPITPARVLDTRAPGGGGAFAAGESRTVAVPAVPAGAVAVAYNLTAANPATGGHLRLQPGDAPGVTPTSVVNFRPGENISNAAIVKLSPTRTVKVYAATPTQVVLDIVGYFVAGTGSRFTAITPMRVYDTASDAAGLLPAKTRRLVSPRTAADGVTPVVPAGASAVAYNITVTDTSGAGHLRVMPAGAALTPTSALNWAGPGERIANASVVGLDAAGRFEVYNGSAAPVRFLVDVVGYYSAVGEQFYAIDPVRTLDTRSDGWGPITSGSTRVRNATAADVSGFVVAPVGSTSVAYNVTVTNTGSAGHLRLYPAGTALPNTSVLNWPAGGYTRANASSTRVSVARTVTLYNGSSSSLDAIMDVNGYYR